MLKSDAESDSKKMLGFKLTMKQWMVLVILLHFSMFAVVKKLRFTNEDHVNL